MPPVPKPAALRQRQNRTATKATIEAPPAVRVELDGDHHARTVAWWDVIWSSPISAEWVDADVPGLVALATLWDEFWGADDDLAKRVKAAAEIRMASMQFGLTPMARRSLQWEVRRVERASDPAAVPTPTRRRDPRLRALA